MQKNRSDDTQSESLSKPSAGLYVVATPIGNLGDITLRALEVLKAADMIVCEDTRVTAKLLQHFGIKSGMLSYNDHNAASIRPKIMASLKNGEVIALVSDAGTPLVSDPGYKLVREAVEENIPVTSLPGASAMLAAIASAALPSDQFFFGGFLPPKTVGRKKMLESLKHIQATLIFYESPNRASEALADMAEVFGPNRKAVLARELTKKFEEIIRAPLSELHKTVAARDEIKGEVVLLVGPPEAEAHDEKTIDDALAKALKEMSLKEAAAFVAEGYGVSKNDAYRRALEIKDAKN